MPSPGRCATARRRAASAACSNDSAAPPPLARGAPSSFCSRSSSLPGWSAVPSPASCSPGVVSRPGTRSPAGPRRSSQAATGEDSAPGLALLVRGADPQRGRRSPGAAPRGRRARGVEARGRNALVTGTIAARADEEDVGEAAVAAFAGRSDVTVGGPAVAGTRSARRSRRTSAAPSCSRSRSCCCCRCCSSAAAPRCCRSSSASPPCSARSCADRRQRGLRPQRVRAEPRDRPRARPGDRLHAVPGHALPRGAGRGRRAADAVRTTMAPPAAPSPSRAATVAAALATLTVFPLGFAQSMGIAGACVAVVAAAGLARRLARAAGDLGPQAAARRDAGAPRRARPLAPPRACRDAPPGRDRRGHRRR